MKLYTKYASIILRGQLQYKASFVMMSIGHFLVSFSALLGIWFMLGRFNQVGGFTLSEVLICYAVSLTSFSLAECFVRGFDAFTGIISNGEFDRIMLRPRNEIGQVLASRIEFSRLGRLLQGIGVLIYAVCTCHIGWTIDKILTVLFMLVGGFLVYSGLFIVSAGLCFFTIERLEVMNILTDGGKDFGKYPYAIYGEGVLKFLTYIIPLALFQYYPFLYLIGRTQNHLFMFLPLIACVFVIPCLAFWRFGVRHYKSTGS